MPAARPLTHAQPLYVHARFSRVFERVFPKVSVFDAGDAITDAVIMVRMVIVCLKSIMNFSIFLEDV